MANATCNQQGCMVNVYLILLELSIEAFKAPLAEKSGNRGAQDGQQEKNDNGFDRREPGFLPGSSGKDRTRRDDPDLAEGGYGCSSSRCGAEQARSGGDLRGSKALRRFVQVQSGCHRRRDRDVAEFW